MARPLRIIQWNAEGLSKTKVSLLKTTCVNAKADVILLSETHLRATDRLKIPHYHCYRKDEISPASGQAYRGLAVLVKRNVVHQQLPTPSLQSGYALGVELLAAGNPTRVFAFYKPPATRLAVADVHTLLDSPLPTIIAGDFNCKHTAWNSATIGPNGRLLLDDAERMGYVVQGPETPTHYPHNPAHMPDVIDLAITQGLNSQFSMATMDDHLISDHQLVLMTVDLPPTRSRPIANKKSYNWEAFQDYVHIHIPNRPITTPEEVDSLALDLASCLRNGLESASSPISLKKRKGTPASIMKLIHEKRRLRRHWQRSRCPALKAELNSLAKKIATALDTVATESWLRVIEEASEEWTSIHRLCRRLSGASEPIRPLLASDGTPRYRAEDRAEIFAKHLESQFRPNLSNDEDHTAEVHRFLTEYFSTPLSTEEDPLVFSPGQVQRVIRRLKPRKAPGADLINNEALRRLPPRAIAAVTRLYNGILRTGHFPTPWKLGRVIMLPKPGKNILRPESYRPITLLPNISKAFEKLLLRHLTPHIQPRMEQFGFRAEHSTTLQLSRVLHHMTEAFNKKEHTIAVLLDMEKAFDRVWHPGLIYKLATSTTPRRVVRIVATFLKDRRFQVVVEGTTSQECKIEAGVPQGSCLSPACYGWYTNDIPVEGGASLALYADDAAFYRSSTNASFAARKLQTTLDALPAWLARWRLSVNVAKTQAITIGNCRQLPPPLRMFNQEIGWTPQVKYLGVTIDRRLTMAHHIQNTVNKSRSARNLLRPVLASSLPLRAKLGIYKAYIRTRLTYAAPAWYALAAQSNKNRLRAQQALSLRTIEDAPRFVRNETIQRDLQIENLDAFVTRLTKRMFERADVSEHPHIREIAPHHARPPDRKRYSRDLVPTDEAIPNETVPARSRSPARHTPDRLDFADLDHHRT